MKDLIKKIISVSMNDYQDLKNKIIKFIFEPRIFLYYALCLG